MDTGDLQPSTHTPPDPLAAGEGAPVPPPPAEVILPQESAPAAPPGDPYHPDWDDQTWQEHATYIGMDRGELKRYYAPAKEMFEVFGAGALLEDLETSGLVSPSNGIRGLGKFGDDRRVWKSAHDKMLSTLPKGAAVNVAPLTGAALEAALDALVRDYLPGDYARLVTAGVLQSSTFRAVAVPLAQEKHRYTQALPAPERAVNEHQAMQVSARERGAVEHLAGQVRGMSEADYHVEIGALYDQLADANREGRDTSPIKAKILRLSEARR